MTPIVKYTILYLFSVFISAVAQVLLKKSANRTYPSWIREYLNPLVIGGYSIFVLSTILTMLAYREVPLSFGPVLEATSYVYVTFFGVMIFHERLSRRKVLALVLIVAGIVVYSLGVG